jgi:hypothetical protein
MNAYSRFRGDNVRKYFVKHENLRRYIDEFCRNGENPTEENMKNILGELKHSNLIIAASIPEKQMAIFDFEGKRYGFLFTDMAEYRKFFPDGDCGCQSFDFEFYKRVIDMGDADGFVLNPESEGFPIIKRMFDMIKEFPEHKYCPDEGYTASELKSLRDSIDNGHLEEFIKNSSNIGRYEELFSEISDSTLLTLMVSREDLDFMAEDGVISMVETDPKGFLYLDELGGKYATVYTSEDKIANVHTDLNKYSQLVNFSQLTNFILNDDLDGIIINPNSENVMLIREVLLEYSPLLEHTCNDSRLNTAIMHMFLIKGEA